MRKNSPHITIGCKIASKLLKMNRKWNWGKHTVEIKQNQTIYLNKFTALISSMTMETTVDLAFLAQEYIKDELSIRGQYRIKWPKIYQNIMICKSWSIKAIRKLTDSKLVGRNKIRILITKLKWIRWAAHNSRPSQSDSHMILSKIGKQLGNLALVQRTRVERYLV